MPAALMRAELKKEARFLEEETRAWEVLPGEDDDDDSKFKDLEPKP